MSAIQFVLQDFPRDLSERFRISCQSEQLAISHTGVSAGQTLSFIGLVESGHLERILRRQVGCNAKRTEEALPKNRTARRYKACGPPGGLFGIDQEVVTLRGLYGDSGFRHFDDPDRPASGGYNPLLTGSVRTVASGANSASEAPLRATCSKSQPPHLVFEYLYYCLQNLSSDHLLSGVTADYYGSRRSVNRQNALYRRKQQGDPELSLRTEVTLTLFRGF
jgi:hypothetical protein